MSVEVVDPRPPSELSARTLAARPGTLDGARVILFDNGKLDAEYGSYGALLGTLENVFGQRFAEVTTIRQSVDLLAGGLELVLEVADNLTALNPQGVVLGLCDWGVSQNTTFLAVELEARGIPTAILATEAGSAHVLATSARLLPGIPCVAMRSLRTASIREIETEIESLSTRIVTALTTDPSALRFEYERKRIASASPRSETGRLAIDGADPSLIFTQLMADSRLGDGLPLVAPTVERVEAFLAASGFETHEEVWPPISPRPTPVTALEIAAVAVAAGCRPIVAPIVFAAYSAMARPEFRLTQAAITTHPSGTLVLVSGPNTADYGLESGRGSLGPGFPANSTVGRAVALGYSFLLGAVPGGADLTAQGSPAEFTYCTAENLGASPWTGLNEDLGFAGMTTVTVFKAEGPHNVTDQQGTVATTLLDTVASTMATLGSNAAYVAGSETVLMLNPEHARLIADEGWTKADVQRFLFDRARNDRGELAGRGLAAIQPEWFSEEARVPTLASPEHLLVAVVGGDGPASQVVIPWGYSAAVTSTVRIEGEIASS